MADEITCAVSPGVDFRNTNAFFECDCEASCDGSFEQGTAENTACRHICEIDHSACQAECVIDTEDLDFALSDCGDSCGDDYDDCFAQALSDEDECASACEGDGTCLAACLQGFSEDEADCRKEKAKCLHKCQVTYYRGYATITATKDGCGCDCCNSDPDGYGACLCPCSWQKQIADTESNAEFYECTDPCVSDLQSGQIIFEPGCFDSCNSELAAELHRNANEATACSDPCGPQTALKNRVCAYAGICDTNCQKTALEADSDCYESFTLGGNTDESGYRTCVENYTKAKWDCQVACCKDRNGKDKWVLGFLECNKTLLSCQNAAQGSCPPPGHAEGQPCHNPSSEECASATADYEECLDAELGICNDDFSDCRSNIDGKRRCESSGCFSAIGAEVETQDD